jgi:CheY-like chemotaxis protein
MPHRVLIADDHHGSLEALEMLFRMRGYEVDMARDGIEAIELAQAVPFDVAVLDIAMPGRDGYAVAREIRGLQDGWARRLIAVTAFGGDVHARLAADAGFDRSFIKPVSFAQLEREAAKGRHVRSQDHCASCR